MVGRCGAQKSAPNGGGRSDAESGLNLHYHLASRFPASPHDKHDTSRLASDARRVKMINSVRSVDVRTSLYRLFTKVRGVIKRSRSTRYHLVYLPLSKGGKGSREGK